MVFCVCICTGIGSYWYSYIYFSAFEYFKGYHFFFLFVEINTFNHCKIICNLKFIPKINIYGCCSAGDVVVVCFGSRSALRQLTVIEQNNVVAISKYVIQIISHNIIYIYHHVHHNIAHEP